MTPNDLPLDAPFISLVEGAVQLPIAWGIGVANTSGAAALRTPTLNTKLDWTNFGNTPAPRITTRNVFRGLLVEEYRQNYVLGNLAGYTRTNCPALTSAVGPSRNQNEASVITSTAAGDAFVTTPLLAGVAGKTVAASWWAAGGDTTVSSAFVQFLAGGAQFTGACTTLFNGQSTSVSAVPAGATTFNLGFAASAGGQVLKVAYPQVELASFATSPIIGTQRFAEQVYVATPTVITNGRICLNIELFATCPSSRTDGATAAAEVLPLWYANANNQVYFTTGASPTITVVLGGVSEVVSCPTFATNTSFKFWLCFGGGKTKIAVWGATTNAVAQCLSGSLTTLRAPLLASSLPFLGYVLSDTNASGKRLCSIVQNVQFWPTNASPEWVGCSCG
jgi:hypothetical protein